MSISYWIYGLGAPIATGLGGWVRWGALSVAAVILLLSLIGVLIAWIVPPSIQADVSPGTEPLVKPERGSE